MLDRTETSRPQTGETAGTARRRVGRRLGRGVLQTLLMLLVLAGSYAAMEAMVSSRPARAPRIFEPTVYTVETVPVAHGDNQPTIHVFGQIDAARSVDLRALVNGEVIDMLPGLAAGRRVSRGDVLVRVDPFAYEGALVEAEANLAAVKAAIAEIDARLVAEREQLDGAVDQLALARTDLDRAAALADSGTLTSKQLEDRKLILSQREQAASQSRNAILVAEAQRAQQQANADRLEWKLREARRNLADTALTAPFDGIISEEIAGLGRSLSTNDVVASLYDDTALEAHFGLTNAQYGRMATDADPLVGRSIEIVWTVGGADYRYQGTIDRIGAKVTAERGGVDVYARIETADYAVQLRPGAFVALSVPDRAWPDTVRLPETALHDSDHVFTVVDGKLVRSPVEVVAFDGEDVIVRTGLADGARVLVTRLTEATEGLSVRAPGEAKPAASPPPAAAGDGPPRRGSGGSRAARRGLGG
ncbi:RND family efflux transporter MFP subunit [Hoeflea marina]|uniref:RND family efflux transporter MFP subunit n=1 Tax=Hoeflea marina TaxID=274592 RepID=A0A317PJ87_9HYPH|nr:efflux RND transporter periplasmic adaptor subunit [Hoeflea marina]PWV99935.1 RND family efflux transporter MFP subunit [Hoeflea marina]